MIIAWVYLIGYFCGFFWLDKKFKNLEIAFKSFLPFFWFLFPLIYILNVKKIIKYIIK